jgi:cell division transport system permease protein
MRRKSNHLYTVLSFALVLFLLGFFGLALLFVTEQTATRQSEISMMVELKDNADSIALANLSAELPQKAYVKPQGIRLVPKEEAAAAMRAHLGDEFLEPDMPLPFYDTYSVEILPQYLNSDSLEFIRTELKENLAVSDVYIDEGYVGELTNTIEKIAWWSFAVACLFVLVAITLMHNTIRLNLYSDRFIIKNKELVGASWQFISRPYLVKGIWNGFFSALIAMILLAVLYYFLQKDLPQLNLLIQKPVFLAGVFGLFFIGILISWLSTYFVVNRYLRMRLDDLY